jgi:hypothetical protein
MLSALSTWGPQIAAQAVATYIGVGGSQERGCVCHIDLNGFPSPDRAVLDILRSQLDRCGPEALQCPPALQCPAAEGVDPSSIVIVAVILVITLVAFFVGFLVGRASGGVVRVAPLERAAPEAVSFRRSGGRALGNLRSVADSVTGA